MFEKIIIKDYKPSESILRVGVIIKPLFGKEVHCTFIKHKTDGDWFDDLNWVKRVSYFEYKSTPDRLGKKLNKALNKYINGSSKFDFFKLKTDVIRYTDTGVSHVKLVTKFMWISTSTTLAQIDGHWFIKHDSEYEQVDKTLNDKIENLISDY